MRTVSKDTITQSFLNYMGDNTDERLKFVLTRLVTHMHDFVRETNLTHDEWRKGLDLLYQAGQISSPERNEFILFSDVLGISSLVDIVNSASDGTSSSVLGPFHLPAAPELAVGGDMKRDNDGATMVLGGRVLSVERQPVEGAVLEIWQSADNGLYSVQDNKQPDYNFYGCMKTGADGRYLFSTVRPAPYTVPDDGPVGELLRATGRHPWRPAHLHFIVSADGYRSLVTELFPSDDPYLDQDTVFGVREDLIMRFHERSATEDLPDDLVIKPRIATPYYAVDFDFVLSSES
jgi:hydroxyquinol 1,2-dioxygenase